MVMKWLWLWSSNVIGDSHDEANFPHKLLLTDKWISRLREAFWKQDQQPI